MLTRNPTIVKTDTGPEIHNDTVMKSDTQTKTKTKTDHETD